MLLREIKQQAPHINLVSLDPDVKSVSYLEKYGIELRDPNSELKNHNKNDLILSSHSLEHIIDPKNFFSQVKDNLRKNGKLFLEVPNSAFSNDELKRLPYHGPHVLFFNTDSLTNLVNECGFNVEHMTTSGVELITIKEAMKNVYDKFNFDEKNREYCSRKTRLKKVLPQPIKKTLKTVINALTFAKQLKELLKQNQALNDISDEVPEFCKYGGKRWTIRCILHPR